MSDIFQEVDEAVRHEEYLKLWKKYRVLVISLVAALIVAVGGYEGWKYYDAEQRRANSERYAAAMESLQGEDQEAARAALQSISEDAPSGYGALASFRLAAQAAEDGDAEAAAQEMQALAGRSGNARG